MKIKIFIVLICLIASGSAVFAQTKKAQLSSVFSPNDGCGVLVSFGDFAFHEWNQNPDSKIYLIYYEGNQQGYLPMKKKTRLLNLRYRNALTGAKEMSLYLTKYLKIPQEKIVFVNGGYIEKNKIEVWIVPNNAEPPKLTPTLTEKDIKFRKGKPLGIRNCGTIYERQ